MVTTYFIQCHDMPFVKIGRATKSLQKRLATLQIGCPMPLNIIAASRHYSEKELHRQFAPYHHNGEWFRYEGELRDFIALIQSQEPLELTTGDDEGFKTVEIELMLHAAIKEHCQSSGLKLKAWIAETINTALEKEDNQ